MHRVSSDCRPSQVASRAQLAFSRAPTMPAASSRVSGFLTSPARSEEGCRSLYTSLLGADPSDLGRSHTTAQGRESSSHGRNGTQEPWLKRESSFHCFLRQNVLHAWKGARLFLRSGREDKDWRVNAGVLRRVCIVLLFLGAAIYTVFGLVGMRSRSDDNSPPLRLSFPVLDEPSLDRLRGRTDSRKLLATGGESGHTVPDGGSKSISPGLPWLQELAPGDLPSLLPFTLHNGQIDVPSREMGSSPVPRALLALPICATAEPHIFSVSVGGASLAGKQDY